MSKLNDYNVIKEGNLYNVAGYSTTYSRKKLSVVELNGLYDGNSFSVVTTLSGVTASGTVVVLEANWGETLDIYQVHYYHNDTIASGVTFQYGLDSDNLGEMAFTTASGYSVSEVVGDSRFIRVTHMVSPGEVVDINQLVIGGVENDSIGFGLSSDQEEEFFRIPNGPIANMTATLFSIPVYNYYTSPLDIKVCQAPTGEQVDEHVFISTSESGSYYGINEFGFSVPANEIMSLENDSLVYDRLSDISSQWELLRGIGQGRISVSSEGVNIKVSGTYRGLENSPLSARFYGLLSSQTFTGNQSFTLKVKVKLLSGNSDYKGGFDVSFGFSNTQPLPSVSKNYEWPYTDESYPIRFGRSGISLSLFSPNSVAGYSRSYGLLYADGDGKETETLYYDWSNAGVKTFDELSTILRGDPEGNNDWSSIAEFREIIITWDHIDKRVVGFIDDVEIGTYRFINPPMGGCRVFLGVDVGDSGGGEIVFKDFEIDTVGLYTQRNLSLLETVSVNVYGSLDPNFHGSTNLLDNSTSEWVSDYGVKANDWVEFTFDNTPDITGFFIENPSSGDIQGHAIITNVSGTGDTKFLSYAISSVAVSVDSGEFVLYDVDTVIGATTERRFVDSGGVTTTFSGASSVKVRFVGIEGEHDESIPNYLSAVGIQEFGIQGHYITPIVSYPDVPSRGAVPWNRCNKFNLKQYGVSGAIGIEERVCEIARVRNPALLVKGIDYDVSNSHLYRNNGDIVVNENSKEYNVFQSREGSPSGIGNHFGLKGWHFSVPASIWRRLPGSVCVKAVHFSWGSGMNVATSQGLIDKFKVQYLEIGGNPDFESSWVDVPCVTYPYTGVSSEYADYRQYFIDNNDGEYYTDAAFSFINCPGMPSNIWYMPGDIVAKKDFRWDGVWSIGGQCGYHIGSSLYLEFDECVETEAIRVIILECLSEDRLSSVNAMNILFLSIFSDEPVGFLLSPVFDTGFSLNTERIFSDIKNTNTTSGTVLVRSFDEPPLYKSDYKYLNWMPWVTPFLDTDYDYSGSLGQGAIEHFNLWPKHGVTLGSKVYIMSTDSDYAPVVYDYEYDLWSLLPSMGTSVENIRASASIANHSVVLENGDIYVAARMGSESTKRILRYGIEEDSYGIGGWRYLSVGWPEEAIYGAMAGYGNSLYFFCSDGTVIVMDPETGNWDPTLSNMPLHEFEYRRLPWPVVCGSNIYLFGGYSVVDSTYEANRYIDVYNIITDSWGTVDKMPYYVDYRVYALLVGDDIIILPGGWSSNGVPAVFDTVTEYVTYPSVPTMYENRLGWTQGQSFSLGKSMTFSTPWVYNDRLYSGTVGDNSRSFRVSRVSHEAWEPGYLPSKFDPIWGYGGEVSNQSPWVDVSSLGETLTQDRYFQFSVKLESYDSLATTPELRRASVIVPQTIPQVAVSGTGDFHVKLGISTDSSYEGWYGGKKEFGYTDLGWSTFFVTSSDGMSVGYSDNILSTTDSGSWYESFTSPFVVKSSIDEYQMWVTRGYDVPRDEPYATVMSGSLYYTNSSDGSSWETPYEVLPLGYYGEYDSAAAEHCCVIRKSSSEYLMWYTGSSLQDGMRRVLFCDSVDGVSWSSPVLAIDVGTQSLVGYPDELSSYSPSVVYDSNTSLYSMWYSGLNQNLKSSIIYCNSYDGITWGSHKVVVPYGYNGYFDIKAAHYPHVIFDAAIFKMWYVGTDPDGENRIMYCYSSDGLVWSPSVFIMADSLSSYDTDGIGRLVMISNREIVIPNTYFSSAKIKIYNG